MVYLLGHLAFPLVRHGWQCPFELACRMKVLLVLVILEYLSWVLWHELITYPLELRRRVEMVTSPVRERLAASRLLFLLFLNALDHVLDKAPLLSPRTVLSPLSYAFRLLNRLRSVST